MASKDGIFAVRMGPRRDAPVEEQRFDVAGRFWLPWHEAPFPEGTAHTDVETSAWPAMWQFPMWQRMLKQAGALEESFVVYEVVSGHLSSFACFEERTLGAGFRGLFCVGGPVGRPANPRDFSLAIRVLCYRREAVFAQIEPLVEPVASEAFFPAKKWRRGAYKRLFEPCTAWLDLTQDESMILAAMREKGRYNVRLAIKHHVESLPVDPSDENLDIFMRLLAETVGRDGFAGNSRAHYRALLDMLSAQDWGGLFFAKKDGEVIAAGIFSFVGKLGTYYYGASTSDNAKRKFMPAYALQWRAILEAKRRGCTSFDFLGIDDPDKKSGHLAGVTDFKLKFGPQIKRWPAARIFVSRPGIYRFLVVVRWIRRLFGR